MDYEGFPGRPRPRRKNDRRGLCEKSSVIEGLARTAGLITSAAAIMIAVFTAFTLGSFLVVQMLGFTLAMAVFIDATVVRMIVGPALLRLAGDWNWWPLGLFMEPKQRLKRRLRNNADIAGVPVQAQRPATA